jgi:hypothetical protein
VRAAGRVNERNRRLKAALHAARQYGGGGTVTF